MSRLETGIIEIRKKDVSVYDTLYRAVSGDRSKGRKETDENLCGL